MSAYHHGPWRRWRHALGHSIQWRLVALFLLLALGTTAVFLFGMQRLLQGGWQDYARPLVADYVDRLAADIGSPPDIARAQALVAALPISVWIEGPQVRWDSRASNGNDRDTDHGDEALDSPHPHTGKSGFSLSRRSADGHLIRFGLARVPRSAQPRLVGWATLAALLVLTAFAYATVRRLLAPLGPITAGVEAYGRGDFSRPIALRRRDELGALAERIDGMAGNLQGMLDAKRTLLLAISHELRSPLTRARINADLVDEGAPRSALLRDLDEMRDLISSLLESERLSQGHAALQAEDLDLRALVQDVLDLSFSQQDLMRDLPTTALHVHADPTRLRLLLRNLIENSLRHGGDAAQRPVVFLRATDTDAIELGVRDFGPGLSDAQIAQLGQAFYRPDSARTRDSGGVGLGLYLCRLVAQAHGGELRIRRAEPGLEVSARLPRQSPASA